MRKQVRAAVTSDEPALVAEPTTLVTLLKDGNRFEVVISLTRRGTHQLQLLWNRRPFISSVFQRGTADGLIRTAMTLKDELLGRGWRLAAE